MLNRESPKITVNIRIMPAVSSGNFPELRRARKLTGMTNVRSRPNANSSVKKTDKICFGLLRINAL
jgi:hypothetical protein